MEFARRSAQRAHLSLPAPSFRALSTLELSAVDEGGACRHVDIVERLASEHGARPIRGPARWSAGGRLRRFADLLQVSHDATVIDHERHELHSLLALWTLENIQTEGAAHQKRPRPV